MTIVIGLTGGIASGKSTVAMMLRELSIPVIDADVIAREVVTPGKDAYSKVVRAFGEEIVLDNKEIDRAKLGSIIFHDKEKRQLLNSIVHPAVRAEMNAQKEFYIQQGEQVVVLDIPLLFESKLTALVDQVVVVYVDEKTQLERLMKRNDLSETEAKARIASQMPLSDKVALADEVIHNTGTIEQTKEQVLCVLQHLLRDKERNFLK
ncbi:dephospho-CoA kinase [Microbacteriaceae bacterium 4G12]